MRHDHDVSTSSDYDWFENTGHGLTVESCLTFVRGLSTQEVIRRLDGAEIAAMTSLRQLDRYRDAAARAGQEFAAVADIGDGVLFLEQNGLLGVDDAVFTPLSRGTSLAVVYTSENNDDRFLWVADGEVRVDFDPFSAAWREGTQPDALLPEMQRLGFNFSTAEVDDPGWVYDDDATQRAFALAEHVTGIGLTEAAFNAASFLAVAVPPQGLDQGELAAVVVPPAEDYDEEEYDEEAEQAAAWASIDVPDERIRTSGYSGADLARRDMNLLVALADSGDDVCRQVSLWAQEWAFAKAELIDQPFFAPVLDALRQGTPVDDMTLFQIKRQLVPLPMAPDYLPDGSLDLGSRQQLAFELVLNPTDPVPLAAACDAITTAVVVDNGRDQRLFADLRARFPQLG
jgi:hypothetical protein